MAGLHDEVAWWLVKVEFSLLAIFIVGAVVVWLLMTKTEVER